jgi:hypothetical protein
MYISHPRAERFRSHASVVGDTLLLKGATQTFSRRRVFPTWIDAVTSLFDAH